MSKQVVSLPFDAFSKDEWKALAEKELKGKSYDEFLKWTSYAGLALDSWQDQRPDLDTQLPTLNKPWQIVEPVYETDALQANKHALDALMAGAEAIWFEKSYLGAAAEVAAKGIDQNIAPVFRSEKTHSDAFKPLLKNAADIELSNATTTILNSVRLRERGADVVQEVACLISQSIEVGSQLGFDHPMLFKVGYGSEFLVEVAKTRALRLLWSRILHLENKDTQNPVILGVNLTNQYSVNDEHTNILRATASAMAAVTGGAQFVMIEPWDRHWKEPNAFSSRISRNIQLLLKEESKLDKNINPADGSFFIENITFQIAEKAWSLVQHIETEGGFRTFAKSGRLKTMLESSRKNLLEAYQKQKVLLGINKYQPAKVLDENEFRCTNYDLLPDYLHLPTELKSMPA